MKERTDQEWVRLLKQDDRGAVHDLWELLFAYASKLESRYRNLDDPASLVRDAAVQAYRRIRTRGLHQFRFECTFRGYCRVIVVREVLRLARKQLKHQSHHAELGDVEMIPDEKAQLASDASQVRAHLEPCLDRLTSREREMIDLLYLKENRPQDVADRLAISRNYVNVIAWRARRKLRRCLEERGYFSAGDVGHV